MPRDSSGNYSLPLGNPVVDGTIIETSWANPTMSDIATQMNNVLTRDGLLGPTVAPFPILDGALATPGLAFTNALTTGMFRTATYVGFGWNNGLAFSYGAASVDFAKVPRYINPPSGATDLANKAYVDSLITTPAVPGTVSLNPTDITVSRAIALADFGTGLIRINSAGVVAITLPTVAALTLPATPGKVRVMAFLIENAGIPTFAGATASTTINGVAGPTTVLPVGGAPKQWQIVVLTQTAVGSDAWSLA